MAAGGALLLASVVLAPFTAGVSLLSTPLAIGGIVAGSAAATTSAGVMLLSATKFHAEVQSFGDAMDAMKGLSEQVDKIKADYKTRKEADLKELIKQLDNIFFGHAVTFNLACPVCGELVGRWNGSSTPIRPEHDERLHCQACIEQLVHSNDLDNPPQPDPNRPRFEAPADDVLTFLASVRERYNDLQRPTTTH